MPTADGCVSRDAGLTSEALRTHDALQQQQQQLARPHARDDVTAKMARDDVITAAALTPPPGERDAQLYNLHRWEPV